MPDAPQKLTPVAFRVDICAARDPIAAQRCANPLHHPGGVPYQHAVVRHEFAHRDGYRLVVHGPQRAEPEQFGKLRGIDAIVLCSLPDEPVVSRVADQNAVYATMQQPIQPRGERTFLHRYSDAATRSEIPPKCACGRLNHALVNDLALPVANADRGCRVVNVETNKPPGHTYHATTSTPDLARGK